MLEGSVVTMLVVSFCLAAVIIFKKEAIPDRLRRPLAIAALILVVASFVMMVASFLRMG